MRAWIAIGLVLTCAKAEILTAKPCPAPLWKIDLSKYHLDAIVRSKQSKNLWASQWQTQRGIVFTSPDTLLVYYVHQSSETSRLSTRDESGGAGKFILRAIFLDTRNGNSVREMTWRTSASDYSQVYATHNGRFLVRTGRMLRLYSPDFQEIISRQLSSQSENQTDTWLVSLVPPGKLIFIRHQWSNGVRGPSGEEKDLVDTDTLSSIRNPSSSDVALWPEADLAVPELTGHPVPSLTFEEQVRQSKHFHDCVAKAFVGVPQRQVDYRACNQLELLTADGRRYWYLKFPNEVPLREINGNTLVINLIHFRADPFDLGRDPKPLQIAVYDLAEKVERCTIDLTKMHSTETYDFAVSSNAQVAVRVDNQLNLFGP